jgi:hypothetical protein
MMYLKYSPQKADLPVPSLDKERLVAELGQNLKLRKLNFRYLAMSRLFIDQL